MSVSRQRVLLWAEDDRLESVLNLLEERLREDRREAWHPFRTGPAQSAQAAYRRLRSLREGDAMVALAMAGQAEERFEAVQRDARQQGALVFPFLLAADLVAHGPEVSLLPDAAFETHVLEARRSPAALAREIAETLAERLRFADPRTDLLLRDPGPEGSPDPLRRNAAEALAASVRTEASPLHLMARETRRQAVVAIRGRLLEAALTSLREAMRYESTSALTAYWIARLIVARNAGAALEEGLREAVRAARLARLEEAPPEVEVATWRLAARLAAMSGDGEALEEFLQEAARCEPPQRELALENLRLYVRGGLHRAGLRLLERLYEEDRTVAQAVAADPLLVTYRAPLQNLAEARGMHLRDIHEAVLGNARQLAAALKQETKAAAREPADPNADILDWLEDRILQSLERQLALLSQWAVRLVAETRELEQRRAALQRLAAAPRELPVRSDLDAVMERLWPGLRRRHAALAAALVETDSLLASEQKAIASRQAHLQAETVQFIAQAEAFEGLVADHPELLVARLGGARSALAPLVLLDRDAPPEHLETRDLLLPDDLRETLGLPAPEAPPQGLYRIEEDSGITWGTRAGVYFAAARQTVSPPSEGADLNGAHESTRSTEAKGDPHGQPTTDP